jgi:hypothetical protein
MSTWLAVVLSGSVFPSPTVRDSDLVSDHPPPPDDDDDDGAADAASDPAEATADATLALIACAAVVDDARMFEVRPERVGKETPAGGGGGATPLGVGVGVGVGVGPVRVAADAKVVASDPNALHGLPPPPPKAEFPEFGADDGGGGGGGGGCGCGCAVATPPAASGTTTTASSSSSSSSKSVGGR